ncbi:hypothetical protein MOQ72_27145 [Saccharopolyspora sp. K220]|uniref:hypothetical protein n=1 Tax=Saccharopolyspora soli TaxID=2926618 RepID=UPI001F571931|nr:hypothetical protein [Saccharopolyspora soli]MCI2421125.1 hypothetical protein [Saccharopolyspora soli]
MRRRETLTGISSWFSLDEIECLVRTAGDAVCGDIDDINSHQRALAERVYDLIHEERNPDAEAAAARPDQRLLALAEKLELDTLDLYDVVHDLHTKPASTINNDGLETQIRYLLDQLGEAETEQVIRDAATLQHVDQH